MDRQPAITGTFVDIDFHFDEFVKNLSGLTKNGIVKCTPTFFAELVDYKGLFLFNFQKNLFLNIFRIVLKDI